MLPNYLVVLMRRSARYSLIAQRHLLSKKFALDDEWRSRHYALSELGIEGSYEWITAVQKKFVSAGVARYAEAIFYLLVTSTNTPIVSL